MKGEGIYWVYHDLVLANGVLCNPIISLRNIHQTGSILYGQSLPGSMESVSGDISEEDGSIQETITTDSVETTFLEWVKFFNFVNFQ